MSESCPRWIGRRAPSPGRASPSSTSALPPPGRVSPAASISDSLAVGTRSIQRAIEVGAEFLLSRDPAVAEYPFTERVSSTWFKFGFPLSYWSDVLETTSVLVDLGFGQDARLENAVRYILSKQDSQGRWKLENSLNGKMWIDIEAKGKPSKWVTLRALRVIKGVQGA